jgi:fibronectin-binding autotransporter adhesin
LEPRPSSRRIIAVAPAPIRNRLRRRSCLILALALAGLGGVTTADGQTWIGGTSSSWATGANWSGGVAPTGATSVQIDTQSPNPTIANGVIFTTTQTLRLGVAAGTSGQLSLTGGSQFSLNGMTIGDYGTGILNLTDGTINSGLYVWVGDNATGNGTFNVVGNQARFNSPAWFIDVGNRGTGYLNILDGGQVRTNVGYVGDNPGSNGFVTVSGAGSLWQMQSLFGVGGDDNATVLIENGGQVITAGRVGMSYNPVSDSLITVTGAGSLLQSADLAIGFFGPAQLRIANGALVSTGEVGMAIGADASGVLSISGTEGARGTLRALGIERVGGAGSILFDGGVLQATQNRADYLTNFAAGSVQLLAGGGIVDTNGFSIGINTPLTGIGGLTKTGAGTLTLAGISDYQGGTTVTAGTLAGSVTAIRGPIRNAGTIDLTETVDASLADDISGLNGVAGQMIKRGAGVLTLTGSNGLDWSLAAGGLTVLSDRFAGNVALAAGTALRFTGPDSGTYAGSLSGVGSLALDGGSTLVLAGNSAGFLGNASVSGAGLQVDGVLGGNLSLTGASRLSGLGQVGNLSLGAGTVIAPGPGIGVLTVAGDLQFDPATRYEVQLGGNGAADRIAVTGAAHLGGTIEASGVDPQASYQTGMRYRVLDAALVDGAFAGVTSQSDFLQFVISQQADAVDLIVTVAAMPPGSEPMVFGTVAQTPNEVAAASALDSFIQSGDALEVYNRFLALDAASARRGLDQISGEIHAAGRRRAGDVLE